MIDWHTLIFGPGKAGHPLRAGRTGKTEPMATVLPELVSYLEGLPEPHILFDRQYRIVAANAAYRRQFSPRASVVGRTCYEV